MNKDLQFKSKHTNKSPKKVNHQPISDRPFRSENHSNFARQTQLSVMAQEHSAKNNSIKLTEMANQNHQVGTTNFSPVAAITQLARSKKSGWNDKQKEQNRKLFERRERRAKEKQEREEKETREEVAAKSKMKQVQIQGFDQLDKEVQRGLIRLHAKGFDQQNSAPRAVFNKGGNFAQCMAEASSIVGDLGANREDGIALNALGQVKERYMVNWKGVTVIVRNFSSNDAILGTIEFQAPPIFEFKYQ